MLVKFFKIIFIIIIVGQLHKTYANNVRKCERINVRACQGLGYNTTSMPNFIGHEDQHEANFKLQNFDELLQHKCSPFLRLFMCSVFVPLCSEHVPGPVPACRGLCEEVRENCLPALKNFGFDWPLYLNCSRFPEPPDLCMQQPSDDDPLEAPGIEFLTKERVHKIHTFPQFCPPNTILIGDKCFKLCNSFLSDDQLIYKVWSIVWSTLCLIFTSFALITFTMDSKRFRWPARPLLYLAITGCVYSNIILLRFFLGSFTCQGEISLQKPYDDFTCVFIALLIVFIDFSYTLWWCALSYVWYLSASKEWSTEAIERISSKIHFVIWMLSLIPIICALFSNKMRINDFIGFCQFSTHILSLIEILIIVIGIVLAIRTSIGLRRIRKSLVCARRPPYKLDKLICRLFIISLGVCVPWLISVFCQFFENKSTNIVIEMLKIGMKFLSFIFASFWVFSPKTFKTWNKLLRLKGKDKTVIMPISKV